MEEPLPDRIIRSINDAAELYNRLVLLVAVSGAGKTALLKEIQIRIAAPFINVNLLLSRRLLDLDGRLSVNIAARPHRVKSVANGERDNILLANVDFRAVNSPLVEQ